MEVLSVNDPAAVARTAEVLRRPGAVVLVPTETVYGLVGNFADPEARARIFQLKARSADKKLGCFLASWRRYDGEAPEYARRLAERYFPGPLTLILPGKNGETIGVRVPDHPFLLKVLAQLPFALAQTSANLSGAGDSPDCLAALAQLNGEVDLAIDGGALAPGAVGSTVVDCTGEVPRVVRQGKLQVVWEQ